MPPTMYYVRPTNGADVAGQGTTHATAYQTTQFALNDIGGTHGRDAVNGDQVNVCDRTAEGDDILGASLSLAGYGAPTTTAPLYIRGYTSIANDGGIGGLDGNAGNFTIISGTPNYIKVIDMECHNVGAASVLKLGNEAFVCHCSVHDWDNGAFAGEGIAGASGACIVQNTVYNGRYIGIACVNGLVAFNYVRDITQSYNNGALNMGAQVGQSFFGNIVHLSVAASIGIYLYRCWGVHISHNILWHTNSGTAQGILSGAGANYHANIFNNIIGGFSGVGGTGISIPAGVPVAIAGNNAFYNNSTDQSYGGPIMLVPGSDVALGADPFTNAAAGNFMLTTAAQAALRSVGWPEQYLGATLTDPQLTIGAVQYGEAVAATGRKYVFW